MKSTRDLHGLEITELPMVFSREFPNNGNSVTRVFKGTEAEILAKEQEMLNLGFKTKRTGGAPGYTDEGTLFTLECTIAYVAATDGSGTDTNVLTVVWEIQPQTSEKNLLESREFPLIRSIPPAYKKYIQQRLQDPDSETYTWVDLTKLNGATVTYTSTQHNNAKLLWDLSLHGANTVDITFPVVRRTVTPPIDYSLAGYNTNAGKVLKKATLVNNENVPSNFAYILPAYPEYESSDVVTIDGLTFWYGYKKGPTVVQQISNQRNQVTQDWTFGLYSADIYGASI